MDIRKYEVLLAVVDKGSFIKAANELGYTQSGITHMMNSLEKECGFPLLMRSNKGVSLTLEGEKVLPAIRELIENNNRLEQSFGKIKGLKSGVVRIGCFPTIACAFMPKIYKGFQKAYPDIQLDIVEENSSAVLEQWLLAGTLDVIFFSKQEKQSYDWVPLCKDEYRIVMPKGHELEKYDCVPAPALMDKNFFMFRYLDGADRDISLYFENNQIDIEPTFTTSSDYAVMYMLDESVGIAMQPTSILDLCLQNHPKLTSRPLDPPAVRELGLAVKALHTCPLATQRFIQYVRKLIKTRKQ